MTPCIETDWRRTPDGYGNRWMPSEGRAVYAHRWAWQQANGPIPAGLLVCHHCDNPPCINVEHLFLGTIRDNSADMVAKGRQPRGESASMNRYPESRPRGLSNGAHTKPERRCRGESHGRAKLTIEQAVAIRYSSTPARVLAEVYGVIPETIYSIRSGRTWATAIEEATR